MAACRLRSNRGPGTSSHRRVGKHALHSLRGPSHARQPVDSWSLTRVRLGNLGNRSCAGRLLLDRKRYGDCRFDGRALHPVLSVGCLDRNPGSSADIVSRRIIVLGGTGFFGRAAVELLQAEGLALLVAAREIGRVDGSPPDLRLDAEDPAALRQVLLTGD